VTTAAGAGNPAVARSLHSRRTAATPDIGGGGDRRHSRLAAIVLSLLALLGIAGLLALGVWQLERRVWKLELIDRVEQRIHAPPVAAPGPSTWPAISAAKDEYHRVGVSGEYLNDREALVQAVTGRGRGFWVMTPLRTDAGYTILINRGFIPSERRDPATRPAGQTGRATVTGLIRMTEPHGGFLRTNDPVTDRWYSRDVTAIAAARDLSDAAPYFIDADAAPDAGGLPVGGLTVIRFPNNHLVYALTWFALAAMLAGALVHFVRQELRGMQASRTLDAAGPVESDSSHI